MGKLFLPVCLFLGTLITISLCEDIPKEIVEPPYFNVAEGRRIVATATCGDQGPEEYCVLPYGNDNLENHNACGHYCDMEDPVNSHHPIFAIDGSSRTWQSPPLSRSLKYNEVDVRLDFGQPFAVAYVFVTMGNSPRPIVWALEKSTDYGHTWKPWQYFADSLKNCEKYFNATEVSVTRDDSVICDTSFSDIRPYHGGEIVVSLLHNRPSATSASTYYKSSFLKEWVKATNIRLRLLKSFVNKGFEPLKYGFYSIADISIGGRCNCNGHADLCDITDPHIPHMLLCRCMHNTCGINCQQCCPGFFKASQNGTYVCEECGCNSEGATGMQDCDKETGTCACREGFTGRKCDQRTSVEETNMAVEGNTGFQPLILSGRHIHRHRG